MLTGTGALLAKLPAGWGKNFDVERASDKAPSLLDQIAGNTFAALRCNQECQLAVGAIQAKFAGHLSGVGRGLVHHIAANWAAKALFDLDGAVFARQHVKQRQPP
jgi:hypothetical protein